MDFSRLAKIRYKKELSQREVAKILKVSKSTYARWETGEQAIPLPHLNDFCQFFKVSFDYVIGLNENNRYSSNNYSTKISKEKIGNNLKLIRKKNKLTQKDLAAILNTSQSTICAYEKGKTLVLTAFLYSVCREFSVSADKICGRHKEKKVLNANY